MLQNNNIIDKIIQEKILQIESNEFSSKDNVWKNVEQRLNRTKNKFNIIPYTIAASIIFLVSLGLYNYFNENNNIEKNSTITKQKESITKPTESSIVNKSVEEETITHEKTNNTLNNNITSKVVSVPIKKEFNHTFSTAKTSDKYNDNTQNLSNEVIENNLIAKTEKLYDREISKNTSEEVIATPTPTAMTAIGQSYENDLAANSLTTTLEKDVTTIENNTIDSKITEDKSKGEALVKLTKNSIEQDKSNLNQEINTSLTYSPRIKKMNKPLSREKNIEDSINYLNNQTTNNQEINEYNLINQFNYNDKEYLSKEEFIEISTELSDCPWNKENKLLKIDLYNINDNVGNNKIDSITLNLISNTDYINNYKIINYKKETVNIKNNQNKPSAIVIYEINTIKNSKKTSDKRELGYIKIQAYQKKDKEPVYINNYPIIDNYTTLDKSSNQFKFASSVAWYTQTLKQNQEQNKKTYKSIFKLSKTSYKQEELTQEESNRRQEFISLIEKHAK